MDCYGSGVPVGPCGNRTLAFRARRDGPERRRADSVGNENLDGCTPLHWASSKGHTEIARDLLEHGANATAQYKDGCTPLHLASYCGHAGIVHVLLEHRADATAQDKDGRSPLQEASSNGHTEIARMLLEHGADVMVQDKDGWTPLHETSSNGHAQISRLLLEYGADPIVQDKDGWTPLYLAIVQWTCGNRTRPSRARRRRDGPGQGQMDSMTSSIGAGMCSHHAVAIETWCWEVGVGLL